MPRAVQRSVNEFVRSLAEAVLIVLAVSLVSLGLRTGLVVAVSIPLVLAITFLVHVAVRHRPAQDLARRADPVAGPAGRRRDHRGRDDGDQDGAGLRPLPRGELRLHEHRVPDADRHAGHRRRLPADRHGEERHRRVHALDLPGVGDRADRVVGRRGRRDSLPRLPDAAGLHASRARPSLWRAAAGPAAPAARRRRRARPRTRDPDAVYRTPFYRASARWSPGASAHRDDRDRRDARDLRRRRWRCSASCRSSSSRRRRGPSCSSTCACPKAARSRRRWPRRRSSRRSSTREPGIESYVAYVGTGSPRFYLPLDQQLQQANFAQFVRASRRATPSASACARGCSTLLRRRLPGAARPRVAPGERPAGRLPGAVPRLRRGHRRRCARIAQRGRRR